MRIQINIKGDTWFVVDENNKICKMFYSKEACMEYMRRLR